FINFFFFQAEDGIRDYKVTGVQTCALPISKYQYELVVLDDECKPDTGVQVATKAGSDRTIVAGVTHYCSTVAIATVDTYHRFGLERKSTRLNSSHLVSSYADFSLKKKKAMR